MKKLYHKGTVHPSPPLISDHLAFLPAAILTLAAALSPDDREVLSYLISSSSASTFSANPRRKSAAETAHSPAFSCSCFGCYTSYWVRWDESPNRQLIHEIIDAYEDSLAQIGKKGKKNGKGKKEKRNHKKTCSSSKHAHSSELKRSEVASSPSRDSSELEAVVEGNVITGSGGGEGCEGGAVEEKGSVRRFVSFIGERIWGPWGQ
ncbi:unnamed protein product [Sphenostylis stenocarpa]|uniref:Uncharacterized protein n=1 Tax=Sphenostylis stenocarpa TaxID=92480 RepID=A0AA86VP15_9FABA|nr:unnamed protein product [Sphenostylis stenocarpa]